MQKPPEPTNPHQRAFWSMIFHEAQNLRQQVASNEVSEGQDVCQK